MLGGVVGLIIHVASTKVQIASPQHGAVLDLFAVRANGGINLEISIAVERQSQYIHEVSSKVVCLYINGSTISVNCAAVTSGPGLLVPSTKWQAGRTWLHIELSANGSVYRIASAPIMVHILEKIPLQLTSRAIVTKDRPTMTMVLTLTLDDAHRALLLLGSLKEFECRETSIIREVLVVVPDSQAIALNVLESSHACPEISIIYESLLFDGMLRASWNKYAVQMAIKLLVASHVVTNFYITLDADVIVVGRLLAEQLLPRGKAMFVPEPRSVHPHWWLGSSMILGLDNHSFENSTFGVTPAVLSTFGAQVATASLNYRFKEVDWQHVWLESWNDGLWWSEYSLYRLSLDARGLFTALHALPGSSALCNAVWFQDQLPWDSAKAFHSPHCTFSLVQSTTQIHPSVIATSVSMQLTGTWSKSRQAGTPGNSRY